MYTVISQLTAGRYSSLLLDKPILERCYDAILCEGEMLEIVPSYGTNDIAVLSKESFVGKKIALVSTGKRTGEL